MALQSGRARSVRSQIVLSAVPYEPVCDYQSQQNSKARDRRDINHGWLLEEFRNRFRLRFIVLWLSALWRGSLSFTRGLLFFSVRAYSAGNLRLRICDFFGGTLRQRLNDLVAAVVQLCFVCFLTAGFCLLAAGLLPVRGCELVAGILRIRFIKLVAEPRRFRCWPRAIGISRISVHRQGPPFPCCPQSSSLQNLIGPHIASL